MRIGDRSWRQYRPMARSYKYASRKKGWSSNFEEFGIGAYETTSEGLAQRKFVPALLRISLTDGLPSSLSVHQQFSEVGCGIKLGNGKQQGHSFYLTATQTTDIPALRPRVHEADNARLDDRVLASCEERCERVVGYKRSGSGKEGRLEVRSLNKALGS